MPGHLNLARALAGCVSSSFCRTLSSATQTVVNRIRDACRNIKKRYGSLKV